MFKFFADRKARKAAMVAEQQRKALIAEQEARKSAAYNDGWGSGYHAADKYYALEDAKYFYITSTDQALVDAYTQGYREGHAEGVAVELWYERRGMLEAERMEKEEDAAARKQAQQDELAEKNRQAFLSVI